MNNRPKICPTCHTSNPGSAQFCAACGMPLLTKSSNPMQKYPQYKLQPTSLFHWDTQKLPYFSIIICFIALAFSLSVAGWNLSAAFGANFDYSSDKFYLSIGILFSVLSIILCLHIYKLFTKHKELEPQTPLPKLADYIQEYKYGGTSKHPKYVFFVKDNKFGVMNVTEFKVAISAQYDEIAWREPNRILTVTKGNETYDIDIFGNQLR